MENATTYFQLMLTEPNKLTPEQKLFFDVHVEIKQAGEKAAESLIVLAKDMKRMHDERLYTAAGFETFADYVEATLGIKERHAYNYIKLLDLAPDYLKANAGLGVTKLALIASASDEVRAELTSDENTATLSVRELEKKIKEQEAELDRRAEQISFLQSAQSSEQEKKLSDVESAKAELEKEFKKKKEELLQAQSDVLNLTNAKKSLELQLEATKATKVKVKEVVDKTAQEEAERQRARADELEAKLTETTKALENAKSEKKQIASNTIIEFKYKFDDIQRIFGDMIKLIDSMDEASARRCSRAIKAVIEMWLKQRCLAGESGNE